MTVKDYQREGGAMVARPGGPSIIAGILVIFITDYSSYLFDSKYCFVLYTRLLFV